MQLATKGELMIKLAQNDNEIADCFQVMKQLRTELVKTAFVPLVRELMTDGYQLAYLRDANSGCVRCRI